MRATTRSKEEKSSKKSIWLLLELDKAKTHFLGRGQGKNKNLMA